MSSGRVGWVSFSTFHAVFVVPPGGADGRPPPISTGDTGSPQDQWHIGQGRLLPSTSVDQFGATLAKWFGVSAGEMSGILPNIGNFGGGEYPVDLGFMAG